MRTESWLRRVIVGGLALLLVSGVAACSRRTTTEQKTSATTTATGAATDTSIAAPTDAAADSSLASAPYDLRFIDTMMPHHQGAIHMARMAETKASHTELKTFASNMVKNQEAEVQRMQQWREQWYPGHAQAPDRSMAGMMADSMGTNDMQLMTMSGPEFDRMFLDMMIPHHQGAITMAEEALTRSEHQELKTLAQEIVSGQQKEVDQMNQWKRIWGRK